MAEVRRLDGSLVEHQAAPDTNIREALELLVRRNERGELASFVYYMTTRDGRTSNGWTWNKVPGADILSMIGALSILKQDLIDALPEIDYDDPDPPGSTEPEEPSENPDAH